MLFPVERIRLKSAVHLSGHIVIFSRYHNAKTINVNL